MQIPWKEIVIFLVWIVQLSFMVGVYRGHIKHNSQAIKDNEKRVNDGFAKLEKDMDKGFKDNKKDIDELYSKTNENAKSIANMKGRLNSQK